MPSKLLSDISQRIETQGLDAFSKFYMYAGLLSMATVREPGKNFDEVLPKLPKMFSAPLPIVKGFIAAEFTAQVGEFQRKFTPARQDEFAVAQKIVMAYFRKGQLADMAFIIDKMLMHVRATSQAPTNGHNREIYNDINFAGKQAALLQFIQVVEGISNNALRFADNGIHAAVSAGVALTGAIVVVASLFSLGSFMIGAAMVLGGGYGFYTFAEQMRTLMEGFRHGGNDIRRALDGMNATLGTFERDGIYKNFILRAVAKPLFFSAITAQEQIATNEAMSHDAAEQRISLDAILQRGGM